MQEKKILLIGVRRSILKPLAESLNKDGQQVFWTQKYKKVIDDFWNEKFDLIAFGRGIPDVEKDKIKGVFSTKNSDTIFIEGLAPIVPLLAYQVKAGLRKSNGVKKLKEFDVKKGSEIKLALDMNESSHVRIVQYYLDFWRRTHTYYFLDSELNKGKYSITVEKRKNKAFLVIDVNEEEIYIKEL